MGNIPSKTMKFEKAKEFLKSDSNVQEVKVNNNEFIHFRMGVCKPIGRLKTQKLRDIGFVIGDIQTTNQGSKYNPTKVLDIWIYPKNSKHLEE
jgi:hypothetical protein